MVDILVAWHIDKTQTNDVINFTSKVLVDLRGCWLKDIEFTILLLNQFLEDMESYMNVRIIFHLFGYNQVSFSQFHLLLNIVLG